MAESTTDEEVLDHDEVAAKLRAIADEFESDERPDIDLGEEVHTVEPKDHVNYQTTVAKNESMIGSDAEAITVELSWTLDE